jgi:hypothetical protein
MHPNSVLAIVPVAPSKHLRIRIGRLRPLHLRLTYMVYFGEEFKKVGMGGQSPGSVFPQISS